MPRDAAESPSSPPPPSKASQRPCPHPAVRALLKWPRAAWWFFCLLLRLQSFVTSPGPQADTPQALAGFLQSMLSWQGKGKRDALIQPFSTLALAFWTGSFCAVGLSCTSWDPWDHPWMHAPEYLYPVATRPPQTVTTKNVSPGLAEWPRGYKIAGVGEACSIRKTFAQVPDLTIWGVRSPHYSMTLS